MTLVVSMYASHAVGCGFAPWPDHYKNGTTASLLGTHSSGLELDSAPQLSKNLGHEWNCLLGHAL